MANLIRSLRIVARNISLQPWKPQAAILQPCTLLKWSGTTLQRSKSTYAERSHQPITLDPFGVNDLLSEFSSKPESKDQYVHSRSSHHLNQLHDMIIERRWGDIIPYFDRFMDECDITSWNLIFRFCGRQSNMGLMMKYVRILERKGKAARAAAAATTAATGSASSSSSSSSSTPTGSSIGMNKRSFIEVITYLTRNNRLPAALRLMKEYRKQYPATVNLVNVILQAYRHQTPEDRMLTYSRFPDVKKRESSKPNGPPLVSVIEPMRAMYDELRRSGEFPDHFTYNAMLYPLARARKFEQIEEMFADMKQIGILPNVHVYNSLLQGLAKSGELERMMVYYARMVDTDGVVPNEFVLNTLMHAFSRTGDVESAARVFGECQRYQIQPNIFMYNTLLHTFARAGRTDEMFAVFHSMLQGRMKPTLVVFNTILDAFARKGDTTNMGLVLEEMRKHGAIPDECTYNTLVTGYGNARNVHQMIAYFEEMRERDIRPTLNAYHALLTGLGKQPDMDMVRVFQYFEELKQHFIPTAQTYTILMGALSRRSKWSQVIRLYNEMRDAGIQCDVFAYDCVLHALASAGKLGRLLSTWDELKATKLTPNTHTLAALVRGCTRGAQVERIDGLLEEFVSRYRVRPNMVVYNLVLQAYARSGLGDRVLAVLREAMERGVSPDDTSPTVAREIRGRLAATKWAGLELEQGIGWLTNGSSSSSSSQSGSTFASSSSSSASASSSGPSTFEAAAAAAASSSSRSSTATAAPAAPTPAVSTIPTAGGGGSSGLEDFVNPDPFQTSAEKL